jgi:HSP20 family protein
MAENKIQKHEQTAPAADSAGDVQNVQRLETETVYAPDVDIFEDNEHFTLMADMPGIDQGSVDVTVENGVLRVEGRAHVEVPEGYELVGQEYGAGKYRRDFTLSDAVDTEGIKARVAQGVLTVTLPKRAQVKTRKVAITS